MRTTLAERGGDPRERAREADLLAFQVAEIEAAGLVDPEEEAALEVREDELANAVAHREAAAAAYAALTDEGGAGDAVRNAIAALSNREPFVPAATQLRSALAEMEDAGMALRDAADSIEEDPEALAAVRARRQLLVELRRKYGDTVAEVIAFHHRTRRGWPSFSATTTTCDASSTRWHRRRRHMPRAAAVVREQRFERRRTPRRRWSAQLQALALPRAKLSIAVGDEGAGDDVQFLFAANPGEPAQPLRKVASGGELARVMLALRLVLTSGPPTMVFDEVDAGIGGEAAVAVGQALARLGDGRQVLVVTHLPQVAAFADAQVQVVKEDAGDRVVAQAVQLADADRVVELSRMLAGDADSAAARKHAKELLAAGRKRRAG